MNFLIVFLLLIIFSGLIQLYNTLIRGHAPFVFSRPGVLKIIANELTLSDGQTFYELGSANASLLRRLARQYPRVNFVGLEYAFTPWLLGKIFCLPFSNIKIIKQNFWRADLSQADYIYCFLNVHVMRELENKFKTDCKPGATIISYIFQLPHTEPAKTLTIGHEKIYFYRINKVDNND